MEADLLRNLVADADAALGQEGEPAVAVTTQIGGLDVPAARKDVAAVDARGAVGVGVGVHVTGRELGVPAEEQATVAVFAAEAEVGPVELVERPNAVGGSDRGAGEGRLAAERQAGAGRGDVRRRRVVVHPFFKAEEPHPAEDVDPRPGAFLGPVQVGDHVGFDAVGLGLGAEVHRTNLIVRRADDVVAGDARHSVEERNVVARQSGRRRAKAAADTPAFHQEPAHFNAGSLFVVDEEAEPLAKTAGPTEVDRLVADKADTVVGGQQHGVERLRFLPHHHVVETGPEIRRAALFPDAPAAAAAGTAFGTGGAKVRLVQHPADERRRNDRLAVAEGQAPFGTTHAGTAGHHHARAAHAGTAGHHHAGTAGHHAGAAHAGTTGHHHAGTTGHHHAGAGPLSK